MNAPGSAASTSGSALTGFCSGEYAAVAEVEVTSGAVVLGEEQAAIATTATLPTTTVVPACNLFTNFKLPEQTQPKGSGMAIKLYSLSFRRRLAELPHLRALRPGALQLEEIGVCGQVNGGVEKRALSLIHI